MVELLKRTGTEVESISPNPKDMLAETDNVCKYPSIEEILDAIEKANGKRYAYFPNSRLSRATYVELRKKYWVTFYDNSFQVEW